VLTAAAFAGIATAMICYGVLAIAFIELSVLIVHDPLLRVNVGSLVFLALGILSLALGAFMGFLLYGGCRSRLSM
jgi:hypothetical protein